MARETGAYLNKLASTAAYTGIGYGEAAGKFLAARQLNPRHAATSVLLAAYQHKIPVTIHLAIGTDILTCIPRGRSHARHSHASRLSPLLRAREKECTRAAYISIGVPPCSCRSFPESRLRRSKSRGVPLRPITTANFDFIQHYRPLQNVVKRPTASAAGKNANVSRGFAITGTP